MQPPLCVWPDICNGKVSTLLSPICCPHPAPDSIGSRSALDRLSTQVRAKKLLLEFGSLEAVLAAATTAAPGQLAGAALGKGPGAARLWAGLVENEAAALLGKELATACRYVELPGLEGGRGGWEGGFGCLERKAADGPRLAELAERWGLEEGCPDLPMGGAAGGGVAGAGLPAVSVAGITFGKAAEWPAGRLEALSGVAVALLPEPTNPHDPLAIAVRPPPTEHQLRTRLPPALAAVSPGRNCLGRPPLPLAGAPHGRAADRDTARVRRPGRAAAGGGGGLGRAGVGG